MIEESYVSLETARLLKEAGFDVPCTSQYTENEFAWENLRKTDFNKSDYVFSRPTQALAARWLREVHRIVVDVAFIPPSVDGDVWQYFVEEMDKMVWIGDFDPSDRKYATYEEAMEAGLKRGLELIKKQGS